MDHRRFRGYRKSSPRLAIGDYAGPGWYFVTLRTLGGYHWFGHVTEGVMHLTPAGAMAGDYLAELPERFRGLEIGASIVMPNHVHILLGLLADDLFMRETPEARRFGPLPPASASSVVNHYKGRVTRAIRSRGERRFAWQRLYYDRIVRNEREWQAIQDYIVSNPQRWRRNR
jgi:putative transposase